jgi:DNA-binding IclR family transcriptional regulator
MAPTSKTVNSIIKGVEVLKTLADGIDRISELSIKLQLNKSTVHRLLKSLEMSGLVMRDPITRRYYLGSLFLDLASKPIIAHQNLTVCAFGEMEYLREVTRETVVLHIRIGLERICLEELQSLENIKYTAGKGFVTPIYVGSAGKILLSEVGDNELDLLLENIRFISIGPNTITDPNLLLKELKKVKKQGYATSFGERVAGSASISVPIKNYICPVALSVLGPDNRFSVDVMMKALKDIRHSAERISSKLKEANPKGKVK